MSYAANGPAGAAGSALALKTQQLQEVVQELLATEAQMSEARRQKNAIAAAAHAVLGIAVDGINASARFLLGTATQASNGQMQVQVREVAVRPRQFRRLTCNKCLQELINLAESCEEGAAQVQAALQGWDHTQHSMGVKLDHSSDISPVASSTFEEAVDTLRATLHADIHAQSDMSNHPFVLKLIARHEESMGTLASQMREGNAGETQRALDAERRCEELEDEVAQLEAALERVVDSADGDIDRIVSSMSQSRGTSRPHSRRARPSREAPISPPTYEEPWATLQPSADRPISKHFQAGADASASPVPGASSSLAKARALLGAHSSSRQLPAANTSFRPPRAPESDGHRVPVEPGSPSSVASSVADRVRGSVAGLDGFMAELRSGSRGAHSEPLPSAVGDHRSISSSSARSDPRFHSVPALPPPQPPMPPQDSAQVRALQDELQETQNALRNARAAVADLKREMLTRVSAGGSASHGAQRKLEDCQAETQRLTRKVASQKAEIDELSAERDEYYAAARDTAEQLGEMVGTAEAAFRQRDELSARVTGLEAELIALRGQQGVAGTAPAPAVKAPSSPVAQALRPVEAAGRPPRATAAPHGNQNTPPKQASQARTSPDGSVSSERSTVHVPGGDIASLQGAIARLESKLNATRAENDALRSSIEHSGVLLSPAPAQSSSNWAKQASQVAHDRSHSSTQQASAAAAAAAARSGGTSDTAPRSRSASRESASAARNAVTAAAQHAMQQGEDKEHPPPRQVQGGLHTNPTSERQDSHVDAHMQSSYTDAGVSRTDFTSRMDSIRGLTGRSRGEGSDVRALEGEGTSHYSHRSHSGENQEGFDDDNVTVTMSRDVGASFIVSQGSTLQIVNSPAHQTYRTTQRSGMERSHAPNGAY